MRNILNSLIVWYPFIKPSDNIADEYINIANSIKDIKLYIPIPFSVPKQTSMTQVYSVKLWAINLSTPGAEYLSFAVDISVGTVINTIYIEKVPVYDISDDVNDIKGSYVLADKEVLSNAIKDTAIGTVLSVHPACCIFISEAVKLCIETRDIYFNTDGGTSTIKELAKISFVDGNNTVVTKTDDGINIFSAPGIGLGKYKTSPFIEDHTVNNEVLTPFGLTPPKGIKSINGLRGDIYLDSRNSVTITTDIEDNTINVLLITPNNQDTGTTA